MICMFNHQPCQFINCPLWSEERLNCLVVLGLERLATGTSTPADLAPRLTRVQGDVLQLLARGFTNKEIGEALSISRRTVHNHVSDIIQRLRAKNRAQVVAIAAKWGMIHLDEGEK